MLLWCRFGLWAGNVDISPSEFSARTRTILAVVCAYLFCLALTSSLRRRMQCLLMIYWHSAAMMMHQYSVALDTALVANFSRRNESRAFFPRSCPTPLTSNFSDILVCETYANSLKMLKRHVRRKIGTSENSRNTNGRCASRLVIVIGAIPDCRELMLLRYRAKRLTIAW